MSVSGLPVEVFMKDLEAADATEALRKLSEALVERGAVEASFVEAVVEREKEYPTGLMFAGGGVAIPHSDAHHCRRPAIALGLLKEPREFSQMGGGPGEESVPVRTIVMLSVTDSREQAPVLSGLMKSLSKDGVLASLPRLGSEKEAEGALGGADKAARETKDAADGAGWVEKEAEIGPEEGLHARPASLFVKEAKKYGSEVLVSKGGNEVSAKSPIKVMTLGAKKGERVVIRARGEDAREAVDALTDLVSRS